MLFGKSLLWFEGFGVVDGIDGGVGVGRLELAEEKLVHRDYFQCLLTRSGAKYFTSTTFSSRIVIFQMTNWCI